MPTRTIGVRVFYGNTGSPQQPNYFWWQFLDNKPDCYYKRDAQGSIYVGGKFECAVGPDGLAKVYAEVPYVGFLPGLIIPVDEGL